MTPSKGFKNDIKLFIGSKCDIFSSKELKYKKFGFMDVDMCIHGVPCEPATCLPRPSGAKHTAAVRRATSSGPLSIGVLHFRIHCSMATVGQCTVDSECSL